MFLLLLSLAASAEDPKFVPIKKDEIAPFSGRLFNDTAVSKLIVENRLKAEQCQIEIDFYTNRAISEERFKYDLLKAKYNSDKQRLTDLVALKQEENEKLYKYVRPNRNGWWLAGGFMVGTATSIAIMHVVKGDTQ